MKALKDEGRYGAIGAQRLHMDRVHNEAMRGILGNINDTPTESVRFKLDLPPMQTR